MPIHVRDNRGGNWFWLHNVIIDRYGLELGPFGIAVYCCLARHVGQEQQTWVAYRAIGALTGISRTQIIREMTKLRDLGLITIEERSTDHGKASNLYTLLPLPDYPSTTQVPASTSQDSARSSLGPTPYQEGTSPSQGGTGINKTQLTKQIEQEGGFPLRTIWQSAANKLASEMTANNYAAWIAPLSLVELSNNHAVIAAPSGVADYVRQRLADTVADALHVERIEIRDIDHDAADFSGKVTPTRR